MRTLIKVIYAVKATTAEESAANVLGVMRDVDEHPRRAAYYSVKTLKPPRDLEDQPGDHERLWSLTEELLAPCRGPQRV
jgi:hypothetical protein